MLKKYIKFLKYAVRLILLVPVVMGASVAFAYDEVTINNYSVHKAHATVVYDGPSWICSNDYFSIPGGKAVKDSIHPGHAHANSHRGGCLVQSISVRIDGGGEVDTYKSSGTSYSEFSIMPRGSNRFREMSSAEIKYEKQTSKESPGFIIHNKTQLPLTISLDQIGCLYYDNNVMPGKSWDKNTGAVWFTITARIAEKDKNINDWQCALPVLEDLGAAIFGVAFGVAGSVYQGVEYTSTKLAMTLGMSAATAIGKAVLASTHTNLKGAYAGPPYPFRYKCKPEYEVTGGTDISKVRKAKTAKEAAEHLYNAPDLKITKIASKC